MTLIRTILAGLYLALFVLLPWLHMPLHDQGEGAGVQQHANCGGHHGHHSDQEDAPSSEPDDCGICSLAVLQTALPYIQSIPEIPSVVFNSWSFYPRVADAPALALYQARAPPCMTA